MNGSTLAKLLSDADLSNAWLARRLGVTRVSVRRWIAGDEPVPPDRVEQIEAIFAAPLRDLPKE